MLQRHLSNSKIGVSAPDLRGADKSDRGQNGRDARRGGSVEPDCGHVISLASHHFLAMDGLNSLLGDASDRSAVHLRDVVAQVIGGPLNQAEAVIHVQDAHDLCGCCYVERRDRRVVITRGHSTGSIARTRGQ
jgi:hypothetical protein